MPQTQAQQIQQISNDLSALRQEHGTAISAMRLQVEKLEENMKAYETRAEENHLLLKALQGDTADLKDIAKSYKDGFTNFLIFLKWLASIIGMILASVLSAIIISHHP